MCLAAFKDKAGVIFFIFLLLSTCVLKTTLLHIQVRPGKGIPPLLLFLMFLLIQIESLRRERVICCTDCRALLIWDIYIKLT